MKNYSKLSLFFIALSFSSCNRNHQSSAYTFLPLNSKVYIRKDEGHGTYWNCYYENVLLKNQGFSSILTTNQMKRYVLDSAVQLRVFNKGADTVEIIFWKYDSRTAYFIDHKEDGEGGLSDNSLGDVYDDLLGRVICGNTENDSEKWCTIKVFDYNVKTGTKKTDSFILIVR